MRRPDLGRIRADNGEAAIGKEEGHREDQPERRQAEQCRIVMVSGHDGEDARADAQ
jgi:hypothetical protein